MYLDAYTVKPGDFVRLIKAAGVSYMCSQLQVTS